MLSLLLSLAKHMRFYTHKNYIPERCSAPLQSPASIAAFSHLSSTGNQWQVVEYEFKNALKSFISFVCS